jgi:hypothetical protein
MAQLVCGDTSYDIPSFEVAVTTLKILGHGRYVRFHGPLRAISYITEPNWNDLFEYGGTVQKINASIVRICSLRVPAAYMQRRAFNAIFNVNQESYIFGL